MHILLRMFSNCIEILRMTCTCVYHSKQLDIYNTQQEEWWPYICELLTQSLLSQVGLHFEFEVDQPHHVAVAVCGGKHLNLLRPLSTSLLLIILIKVKSLEKNINIKLTLKPSCLNLNTL